nr:hypothetical protein [uncultured Psychroserpens sp.]
MKDLKILFILPVLLTITIVIDCNKTNLETGDIAFTSYNSKHEDSFSFVTLKDLTPNTTIYFTDSEWNGTRFGIKENDLIWNSGGTFIPSNTEIKFTRIKHKPKVNFGLALGSLNLNIKGDAIFAYIGETVKQPNKFIAAVSNDYKQYGTLINTQLEEGNTAITYPKNTYLAHFKGNLKTSKSNLLKMLSDFSNYQLDQIHTELANK